MTRVATTGIETGGRSARRILPIAALLVGAFFVGIFAASRLSSALSATSSGIGWELAVGMGRPKFDLAAAQTTTVVPVQVWWPACVELGDYSWLTPAVSYTRWSVTITLHRSDAYANNPKCPGAGRGVLPVGVYLSPLYFPVHLNEPLGGRALFDGSEFPAAARPYR
jgi:hypothetical protein